MKMDEKLKTEIRRWLQKNKFLWNREDSCIAAFRAHIYDAHENYLPGGREIADFIRFEDTVEARFLNSWADRHPQYDPDFVETIAVLREPNGFFTHYLYDEDKGKGAVISGPFPDIMEALRNIKSRCPNARLVGADGRADISPASKIHALDSAVLIYLCGGSIENYSAAEQAYIRREADQALWDELREAEATPRHSDSPSVFEVRKSTPQIASKPRLFVDMDGTLARFHDEVKYLERMYEPNFFRELKPFENAVNTIRLFEKTHPEWEVYILSSVLFGEPPGCEKQKQDWIDLYLPEIDRAHRLFPDMGTDKSTVIPGGIGITDVLLDDYNKNLEEWQQAGGTAIKFVNNVNDRALRGNRWNGMRMHYDTSAEYNIRELLRQLPFEAIAPLPKRGPKL